MGDVNFTISGDDRDAQAALQRMQRELAKLKEGAAAAGAESKKSSDTFSQGFTRAVGQLKSMVLGYASFQTAIQLANAELRNQLDLQKQAAQAQTTAAGTQIKFLRNLGLVSPEERSAALAQIAGISRETGVTQKDLFTAAGTAVSAKGDLTNAQALAAVRQAALIAPEDAGELTAVAGGLLDLATLTKSADFQANAGFMTALASQARVTNLAAVSQNLVPAAINVAGQGGTAAEAAALTATITSALKDATGATSGTAAIQLANQLAEFEGAAGSSTAERLRSLQADPALARQFFEGATFEQKSGQAVKDLLGLGGDRSLIELYGRNTAAFGDRETLARQADELVGGIRSQPLQQQARLQRALEQATEQQRLGNLDAGTGGILGQELGPLLQSLGAGALEQKAIRASLGVEPKLDDVIALFETSSTEIRKRGRDLGRESDIRQADVQAEILQVLKEMRDEQRGTRRDLKAGAGSRNAGVEKN